MKNNKGFILIELIIVIAIIIIMCLILARYSKDVKDKAHKTMIERVQAEAPMPDDIEKFNDGAVTCYTYNEYTFTGTTDRVGGISCVIQ